MGVFDKFINAIRINDDEYEDDDFYDDDDDFDEDEEEYDEKPKKGFFSRLLGKSDEEDDYDDDEEEEVVRSKEPRREYSSSRITPMSKKGRNMEVRVIKPANMEETRVIADTLLANCTVVLNLEGLDVEVAQRVIDFSSGTCYAISGSLQKVSSYIFVLTPHNVGVSGDITDILGKTDPVMRHNI